jgi:hypothetical protein
LKIVLSRKGFDSTFGECASPIFPGDEILSLPIPERKPFYGTNIRYSDLRSPIPGFTNVGAIVEQLSGKYGPKDLAHLDPHVDARVYRRPAGWRGLFGQIGPAQGHLRKQNVGEGDLFLFYGLYRRVVADGGRLKFLQGTPSQHVIFGWMGIGEVVPIEKSEDAREWSLKNSWGAYHSHLHGTGRVPGNALYVAADKCFGALPGAGVFEKYSKRRCLTALDESCSVWLLPKWFDPKRCAKPLTYNSNRATWRPTANGFLLRTKSPGQEYVLDTDDYREAEGWAKDIIAEG